MQQSANNRKRPAPGTSPMPPAQPAYQYPSMPDGTDYGQFDFSNTFPVDQTYGDQNTADANSFASAFNTAQPGTYGANIPNQTSTDLVRLPRNQQLAQAGQQEQWNGYGGNMAGQPEEEDEQDLDMKVALAKRDAQGKRKQIPPFVQKLSSFLDSNNTELIRWSDDGRSFIVLDEDEFARTLIPELFKHNNYASFVRQLNMYGFHKTVNITDGSLRQSEKARKGVKPPSMYSHPYFRKNRPDLLWLIQKPTGKASAKRKREGDGKDGYGSDDDRQFSPGPEGKPSGELGGVGNHDLATLPRHELASVRQELKKLQQSQNLISHMIAQLKEQNDQFYRQATAFQALHDRHENSINAILTFLATFYNRSLDGHAGQNLVNMFSNAGQNNQQRGGVVEEFNDATPEASSQVQRYKRPPLLLPGPETAASPFGQPGSAVTEVNSERPSQSPPNVPKKRESTASAPPQSARTPRGQAESPAVKTEAQTPTMGNQAESDQMMSLINSVNATNASTPNTTAPTFDFNSALDHYQNANGNAPLTAQQRDDMLALIANHQSDASNNGKGGNNALISPTPPAMPDLSQLKQTQQQLEMLTNMQRQQDEKVQDLHRRLQPLSPTGTIPGLHGDTDGNPFDTSSLNPGDFDPNAFLNFGTGDDDEPFDFGNADNGDDIDWDFGGGDDDGTAAAAAGGSDPSGADMFTTGSGTGQGKGDDLFGNDEEEQPVQGRVESVSSEATSPATATGTVEEKEAEKQAPKKRLRRG